MSEERVLGSSHLDLCSYFVARFTVDSVEIDEASISTDYGDASVDVSHRPEYLVRDRRRPVHVDGTSVTFFVPFTGDKHLLQCRPSSYGLDGGVRAARRGNTLLFTYSRTPQRVSEIKDVFHRDLDKLKRYLLWVSTDVQPHNDALEARVDQLVNSRREKVLQDKNLVASFGFPLHRNTDVPDTYVTPDIKRRVEPRLPPVSTQPFEPEPTLGVDDYEHILSVIRSMVSVIERSPKSFADMQEETLRDHFLLQLNGHYEGQATGETFNKNGRTDILVSSSGSVGAMPSSVSNTQTASPWR